MNEKACLSILLFEDDEGLALLTQESLKKAGGYEIDHAMTGGDGLKKVEAVESWDFPSNTKVINFFLSCAYFIR